MKRRDTASQEAILSVLTGKKRAMRQDVILKKMDIKSDGAT